ncbi:uncharacterized protein LOC117295048 [Asterias rubens]|uniref:uncharacterized protein LOC117295048 n=1 Tax=Asterias rubens TaxID=7604 RepID=UPI001455254E|nr:uncharacterized protein LOC117295048 [Asterias rubens]
MLNYISPSMTSLRSKLELYLLLTMCIYAAKVMIVLVYMDKFIPADVTIMNGQDHEPDATLNRLNMERRNRKDKRDFEGVLRRMGGEASQSDTKRIDNNIPSVQNRSSESKSDSESGRARPVDEMKRNQTNLAPNLGLNSALFHRVLDSVFDHSHDKKKCQDAFMVSLITTRPTEVDFRMAIRETWANDAYAHQMGVLTLFVLGQPTDGTVNSAVFLENERHDDILMGSFTDSVGNSTLKLLLGIDWVMSNCPSAKYVFIGDDHMFIIYERLVKLLRETNEKDGVKMWIGRLTQGKMPERDAGSRYYVSRKLYPETRYPDFCTIEAGYVLSVDAARELLALSWGEPLLPLPDVYMGVLAKKANILIKNDNSFSYGNQAKDACELNRVVTSRGVRSAEQLQSTWTKFSDPEFRRNCPDPDLSLVLKNHIDNLPYLDKTLQMRLNHPDICYDKAGNEESVFILVLISTLPRHFELRSTIRETWGRNLMRQGENIKLLFVMGHTQTDVKLIQQRVKQEDDKFGDIIQADFTESFHNLTLKVVMGLRWVTQNCPHAKYMYKGDDDMFVNFDRIVSHLKESRAKGLAKSRYFLGSVLHRSVRVTRENSKYYVPERLYSGRYFPPYCSGGGYIMSTDIIPQMYRKSLETAFIPIDDAYQGILMSKIGVKPVAHPGFKNWGAKTDGCSLREVMVVHGFKNSNILNAVWRNYTTPAEDCPEVS